MFVNRRSALASTLILTLLLCFSSSATAGAQSAALFQYGVIDALLAGGYDGSLPLSQLRTHGDLGLGTFDALDGEMVLLDGVVYQVPASGQVKRPAPGMTTPFAQVVRFHPTLSQSLAAGADIKAVEATLDTRLGDTQRFAAIRLDATFTALTARSVPKQTPPYRPLAEVAKEQTVFDFHTVRGTLVAMRGPTFVKGLGVPGWHWHFISQDRKRGGHVLSFTLADGAQAKLMPLRRMDLLLPTSGFSGLDLLRDRASELKAVESAR